EFCKICLQVALQGHRAGKVIRSEQVALDLAKDDFHLLQPASIGGQPVEAYLEGQGPGGNPRCQLLRGVSGTVVQDEMEDLEALAKRRGKEVAQEGLEVREAAPGITAGEGVSTGDQQSTKQLQCSPALIAIGHLPRMARDSGLGL